MRIYVPDILGQANQYEEELVEAPMGNWKRKNYYLEASTLEEFRTILDAVESIRPKDTSDWHNYTIEIVPNNDGSISLSPSYNGC